MCSPEVSYCGFLLHRPCGDLLVPLGGLGQIESGLEFSDPYGWSSLRPKEIEVVSFFIYFIFCFEPQQKMEHACTHIFTHAHVHAHTHKHTNAYY